MTNPFDPSSLTHGAVTVLRVLTRIAAQGREFSSDTVRDELDRKKIVVDREAVGNAFRWASGIGGLIVRVGETHSRRREAHRRRILVYRLVGAKDTPQEQQTKQIVLVK